MSDPTQITPGSNPQGRGPSSDATVVSGQGSAASLPRAVGVPTDRSGDRIGEYVLIEKLGTGGFGVVWKAERREPFVQQVALKVLKPGLDSAEVLARFELERQALAMMDHPNIAKVIDGGVTQAGRSYFVMELVKGEPIDRFCDANRLGLRQRLELFAQVCDAVHHAHMKGVIHRDLKPGNILAGMSGDTGTGEAAGIRVKVIDFGVAKATSATAVAHEVFTQTGQMIGTPSYMSPEQLDGRNDIDTRADVYSLGMVLYELLVGAPAFDPQTLRAAGMAEINRIIREQEPPRLTTRLAQLSKESAAGESGAAGVAKARGLQPDALARSLRGELEWLPLKAASKDRNRRYRSAAEFADDVRNWLEGRPLLAGPETAVYRVGKFVRRHRVGVGAGVAVAASLVAATVVSTWFFIREARAREAEAVARQLAERRERETRQIAAFQEAMLSDIDPAAAGLALAQSLERRLDESLQAEHADAAQRLQRMDGMRDGLRRVNTTDVARDFLEASVLRPAQKASAAQFKEQPEVDATMQLALGTTYMNLGMPERAVAPVAESLRLRRAALAPEDRRVLEALDWSGRVKWQVATTDDERKEAERLLRESLEARRRTLGDTSPDAVAGMRGLGDWLQSQGRLPEAAELYARALEAAHASQPALSDDDVFLTASLAQVRCEQGDPAAALALLQPMREALRRQQGVDPRVTLRVLQNLAFAQSQWARMHPEPANLQQTEATWREALDLASRSLGDDHPIAFMVRGSLSGLLRRTGRMDESRALLERSVAEGRAHPGAGGVAFLYALNDLGQARLAAGDASGAEALIAEAEMGMRRALGLAADETQDTMISCARVQVALGRIDPAQARLREVLAHRMAAMGPSSRLTLDAARELGRALAQAGRFAEADAAFAGAESAVDASKLPGTSDARWNLVHQWRHTLEAWAAADPTGPAAARLPAVAARIEQLRSARQAANPPLPVEWKDA